MSIYDAPDYDEPRKWIQKRREQNEHWKSIRMARKKTEEALCCFLKSQHEDNDWPEMNIDDWDRLVDECFEVEDRQQSIRFRGNEGALYDLAQDNGLKIPENPRSCWQLYKNNLNWKQESIQDLEDATVGILRRLSTDTRETGSVKGLVIGHVQSGKTANMEALMAMCADHGWNMFIVLSGTIENLRLQTLKRMEKDLNQEGNLIWRGVEHPSKKSTYGERTTDFHFGKDAQSRYFTVCLKNASRLKKLIEWIHADKASHDQMKILIIDDEADQASISNTAVDEREVRKAKKERKGINKLIVDLVNDQHHNGTEYSKGKAQAINYVMYTATPYANFLNESSNESLYPKDFIWTLKSSDEYIGPNQIYGVSVPEQSDGLDIKRVIPDSELDTISQIYEHSAVKPPESMKNAICWFICAVAVMRYWKYEKPISMLIHTSQKQVCHDAVAEVVSSWINREREFSLMKKCQEVYEYETKRIPKRVWLSQFTDNYGISSSEIRDYPSFEKIRENIAVLLDFAIQHIKMNEAGDLQYHSGLHLVIDNCSKNGISNEDDYVRLAYPEPDSENYPTPAPAFIIIGGSTLSRGLTIEGLVSTFFLRASCQADTLMQMGRWFGYRKGYELMPRIWMTQDTIEKFRFLSELEVELRDDLKRYMFDNVSPSDYGPRIIISPKVSWLRLTSRNHMKNAVSAEMDYSGAKPQTTIFDNDIQKQQQNIKITENFISLLPGKPSVSADDTGLYWENISLKLIIDELLNKFSFSDRSRVFNEIKAFCEWLKQVTKEKTLSEFTVIIAGKGAIDGTDSNESWFWNVAGHKVGKVNRSKRKISDETCIDIGVLRALKDHVADLDKGTIKKEGEILKQEQIDRLRRQAEKQNVPLLLIYRISGSSKPSPGTINRTELDFDSDIIGLQVCVPGDQVNKKYTKKVTVYLPEKDKEDEVEEQQWK